MEGGVCALLRTQAHSEAKLLVCRGCSSLCAKVSWRVNLKYMLRWSLGILMIQKVHCMGMKPADKE